MATALLGFTGPKDYLFVLILFMIANVSFATGNIFYNSFLTALAAPSEIDTLSSRGFAFGYVGGG